MRSPSTNETGVDYLHRVLSGLAGVLSLSDLKNSAGVLSLHSKDFEYDFARNWEFVTELTIILPFQEVKILASALSFQELKHQKKKFAIALPFH